MDTLKDSQIQPTTTTTNFFTREMAQAMAHKIIRALKNDDTELTELEKLKLPDYTSDMVKNLTRQDLTHFRRRDEFPLGGLLGMMSKLQADVGHVWPQVATLFIDVSVSRAVSAAENDDEVGFYIYQRLIHDLYPLMDVDPDDPENCKFRPIPFETTVVLFALKEHESARRMDVGPWDDDERYYSDCEYM
jgi:hypothetical protein